ncbi:hypothetical protein ABZ760_21225 [Streptomyces sp. NPDC006658]|uniref:DUF6907 domain-containing protein n=1 Tax=Streptomyces sp. NPDC006658 TaxID=3156900 RepID=UPI0033FABFA2
MATDRIQHLPSRHGGTVAVTCPAWCTLPHERQAAEDAHHQGPTIAFTGPGDFTGYFDGGEPYEVLFAAICADPEGGRPYVYFDTQSEATGARLDVAGLDAVLGDLRTYVDRLQQIRDRLAQITQGEQ